MKDANIARRLVTIALSSFFCWFPIGVMGLMAARGVPIPSEVNVAAAILVLPLNSALNPFLYNLSMRRKTRDKKLLQKLQEMLQSD